MWYINSGTFAFPWSYLKMKCCVWMFRLTNKTDWLMSYTEIRRIETSRSLIPCPDLLHIDVQGRFHYAPAWQEVANVQSMSALITWVLAGGGSLQLCAPTCTPGQMFGCMWWLLICMALWRLPSVVVISSDKIYAEVAQHESKMILKHLASCSEGPAHLMEIRPSQAPILTCLLTAPILAVRVSSG